MPERDLSDIQNDPFDTGETIYLVFGDNFRYEPSGSGTKLISIVNGRRTVNPTKIRLEIINGGEFQIEWARNIRWKTGTAPQFQPYYTDVLMFKTSDNGQTWVGEVIQTTASTPYWKILVMPRDAASFSLSYSKNPVQITLPINSDAIEYIDWGDGTIEEYPFDSSKLKNISGVAFNTHTYARSYLYAITIKSTKFNTGYIVAYDNDYDDFKHFRVDVVQIVNPIPAIKGSYQNISDGITETDYSLNDVLRRYINITLIPDTFFANNSSYPIGLKCFQGCSSLHAIPPNPFANDASATDLSECFAGCTSLQSIPEGIFDSIASATTLERCFSSCTSLQSIPEGLFDKNTRVTDFDSCFANCTSLKSIPEGLFNKNTNATNFDDCFYGCSSLQSIPAGLFEKNTEAESFISCFHSCSSLTSIPEGLFDNCINAAYFGGGRSSYSEGCFEYCKSLISIPENLFKKNVNVQYIDRCFANCSALNDFSVHIGSSSISKCDTFVHKKTGTTRTVYVPSGSATQTKFNAVASTLGLTIVGE